MKDDGACFGTLPTTFPRRSVEAPRSVALPRISARELVGRDSVEPRMKRRFDHASKFILRPLGSLGFWRCFFGSARIGRACLELSKEALASPSEAMVFLIT